MIDVAKKNGADCVKFQHFYANELISFMQKKHLIKLKIENLKIYHNNK